VATASYNGLQIWLVANDDIKLIRSIPIDHGHDECFDQDCGLLGIAYCGNNEIALKFSSVDSVYLYDIESSSGKPVRELKSTIKGSSSGRLHFVDGRLGLFGSYCYNWERGDPLAAQPPTLPPEESSSRIAAFCYEEWI